MDRKSQGQLTHLGGIMEKLIDDFWSHVRTSATIGTNPLIRTVTFG